MPMQGLDLSPVGLFLSAGLVGKAVMAVLFVASLWCWVLIVEGVVSVVRLRRAVRAARAGGELAQVARRRRRRRATRRRTGAFPARRSSEVAGAHRRRDGARRARASDPRRGRPAQSRGHFLGRAVRRPVRHGLGHHVELRRDLRRRRTRASRPSRPASPNRSPRPLTASPRRFPPRSATTASAPPSRGSARTWRRSSRSARSR